MNQDVRCRLGGSLPLGDEHPIHSRAHPADQFQPAGKAAAAFQHRLRGGVVDQRQHLAGQRLVRNAVAFDEAGELLGPGDDRLMPRSLQA